MTLRYFLDVGLHGDLRDSFCLSEVLAAIHSINRSIGLDDSAGGYPLGLSFPFWVDPKFHATRMMGFGSVGPVVRSVSQSREPLQAILASSRLGQLASIGEATFGLISEIPAPIARWVAFCRASDGESKLNSQARRHARRLAERGAESVQPVRNQAENSPREIGYVKIPLRSASTGQHFERPVRRFIFDFSEPSLPCFDSWGLCKAGGAIPEF
jgi:CRISPR-associated endoribonuclease Cas6/Csy4 subtype I-F